jgi:hypothetical protein
MTFSLFRYRPRPIRLSLTEAREYAAGRAHRMSDV